MENKKRGFHVTIVDNNTGETVRELDTRAIKYVALSDEVTKKGIEIVREAKPFASTGVTQSSLASGITIMEAYALINSLQNMLAEEFEDHPEFALMAKIFDNETVDVDGDR